MDLRSCPGIARSPCPMISLTLIIFSPIVVIPGAS
ncbi:hypothetical protein JMJ77_0009193, partial [Colletotrichum scovillei]